ncbi:MAG: tRNA (adenosine(37)-N6)-dimethylallyltransferase MiaA [Actinomycetaceae bacterium]|nr:tRNA (adenosine(37)-N6)-dimethylallyltransferase MiaA [Actinomycetaceae bacterium]
MNPPLVAVVGPTASGKSSLAHALALRCPQWAGKEAEVISVDAYALYRGMDIGTAKPTEEERQQVRYHQIDQLDIADTASVACYQRQARADVEAIYSRGHWPIAVGGSGLYVRALLDEMNFPGSDPHVRVEIEQWHKENGDAALYDRLRQLDPLAAQRLHPHNVRRVVRALEVIEITGKPFTASLPQPRFVRPTIMLGVRRQIEDLDARIAKRTEEMFASGWVEETRRLQEAGLEQMVTAARAVGYPEVLSYLRGEITLEQAKEQVALATRQLARRQVKWFRRDSRIHWIDATGKEPEAVFAQAVEAITSSSAGLNS